MGSEDLGASVKGQRARGVAGMQRQRTPCLPGFGWAQGPHSAPLSQPGDFARRRGREAVLAAPTALVSTIPCLKAQGWKTEGRRENHSGSQESFP